jgi:hypothetical protein
MDRAINQNFGVMDFAYDVTQAIRGAKAMPYNEKWSVIYFEDDHFALGMVGYGDFRAKGDGTMMYTVKSPSIQNRKYSDYSAQYHMAMSANRATAVKNAQKYLRRISPVEAATYTAKSPYESIERLRKEADQKIAQAHEDIFRRRLYNDKAPILHELRSLVDTGYSFIDASMTDRLRDMFSAIDAAAEENGQVNMTAVFVREERGRQRFDAVLVDKCENYWPDVGDTHMTYYDNELPEHIMGKLAMLSMLNDGAYVHNVGYRINSRMFYVAR